MSVKLTWRPFNWTCSWEKLFCFNQILATTSSGLPICIFFWTWENVILLTSSVQLFTKLSFRISILCNRLCPLPFVIFTILDFELSKLFPWFCFYWGHTDAELQLLENSNYFTNVNRMEPVKPRRGIYQ